MEKYFYKIKIAYNGQRYYGWQIQTETEFTIQGQLNKAFQATTGLKNFKTIGSGRTDAGVHAFGQIVLFETENNLPEEVFFKGVNQQLPNDIKIIEVEKTNHQFHPIFTAKSKIYQYVITKQGLPPFFSGLAYKYSKSLDFELLKNGIQLFLGKHDFQNYFCVGTEVSSTIREIFEVSLNEIDEFDFEGVKLKGDFLLFEFEGSGFLKQQVRLMIGALLALNEKKLSLNDLENSLKLPVSKRLWAVAPAEGLYLKQVKY